MFARYRFDIQISEGIVWPEYAGSMLRGAWGHQLRRICCMTKQPNCNGCPLRATCPYSIVFEPAPTSANTGHKPPVPYVIETDLHRQKRWLKAGSNVHFHMVLMGAALQQLPLIIYAWQQALQRGIGSKNNAGSAILQQVMQILPQGQTHQVWHETEQPEVENCEMQWQLPPMPQGEIRLQLKTPLRLQQQGRILNQDITPSAFLMALVRRLQFVSQQWPVEQPWQVADVHYKHQAEDIVWHSELRWHDWARYSNRQQQKMKLGGLVGNICFNALDEVFWPALYLGQWLHIGKETSFGFGQYQIL